MRSKPENRSQGKPVFFAALLLLALVLPAIFLALAFRPQPEAARPGTPILPDVAGPESDRPAPRKVAAPPPVVRFDPQAPPMAQQPLPPLADLVQAADRGDARAACQLAAEFNACGSAGWLDGKPRLTEAMVDTHAKTLSALPVEDFRKRIEPMRARLRCQTLQARHAGRHFGWLRQAAMAGEPEAMLRYVHGEAFGPGFGGDFSYLRTSEFDTWRREAPGLLRALLEAGYVEALVFLVRAGDPLLGGHAAALLETDPVRDRAYLHLLLLIAGNAPGAAAVVDRLPPLPAAQEVEARHMASQWHRDFFHGVTAGDLLHARTGARGEAALSSQRCSQPVPGARR